MADFKFEFNTRIRITDINYGNHVSYASYLLFFQDARIAYLKNIGCSELDIHGVGMIISEANCKYKRELLLGDEIVIKCKITNLKSKGFEMEYVIEREGKVCAEGKTINLAFDYKAGKITHLPEKFVADVKAFEGI
jgi:YbgC/YbaW family acyl-CoA thioester hydrolase